MRRRRWLLAVIAVLAVLGSGCAALGGGGYEVTAQFSRAFNLFPGSEVRVVGVVVGKVVDVEVPAGSDAAVATLRVDDDVTVAADATATIIQGALLGERFVELDPPVTDGPVLEDGDVIPPERTDEPAEFDEILESLNDFVDRMPPEELARFVRNTADIVRDRGSEIGATLDEVAGAVEGLRATDDELVALMDRMGELSETLATRDDAIGAAIDDYGTLVSTLAAERQLIDAAIGETARMLGEVRTLARDHAGHLDEDIEAVTRVGRTLRRNLPEVDLLLHGQSELYRHAERVFDMQRNWLPLVNHDEGLQELFADRVGERLAGLCGRLGIDQCDDPADWEGGMPEQVCLPGIIACGGADGTRGTPLGEVLTDGFRRVPELPERLASERDRRRPTGFDAAVADQVPGLTPSFTLTSALPEAHP